MSETLSGTYTSGVTLTGNPATITGSGTVGNTAAAGVAVAGPGATNWTLTNQGIVAESGSSSSVGISFTSAGTVINSGSVSGNYTIAGGAGISLAAGGSVTNQSGGTVSGKIAINVSSATAAVVNAGVITGNQTATPGDGVALHSGGSVTNQAGGTISGFYGVVGQTHTISVLNQGTINGSTANTLGIGVYLSAGGTLTNSASAAVTGFNAIYAKASTTVDNAGHVTGSLSNSKAVGAYMKGGGLVTNEATGTITGFRAVFATNVTVVNAGSIGGNATVGSGAGVFLSSGGPVTNQTGGTITGLVGIYGKSAVATIVNSGVVAGNNTSGSGVTLSAGGTVTNLAGGTLSGSYGVGAVSVAATIVNAGYIGDGSSLPTGAGIALKHGGVVTNQSGGKVIAGLQGIYFGGAAATLVNAGTVSGNSSNGNGVIVAAGGALTNQSGGVIRGRYGVRAVTSAFTVVNAGSIGSNSTNGGGGINLGAGGSVTNQSGGTITGAIAVKMTAGTTVENAGSIGGTTAVSFAAGAANRLIVDVGAAFTGTVTGGNTIGASAFSTLELSSAGSIGTLSGLGTQFVNFAQTTIDSLAAWAITGTDSVAAGATVTNSGTLYDEGTLNISGTIINTGTTNQSYGVIIQNSAGFTNLGSTSLIEGLVGMEVVFNDTINAAGTIASTQGTAGTAISFIGGSNRLIDNVGAVFIGGISLLGSTNTLELASASSAGTVSGLGTTITNAGTVLFDTGAQWTVVGNAGSSGLGGTVAIQGFAAGDTIDLTGLAAVSHTFASNTLTLTDVNSVQTTLNIQGGFSTGNFAIASDGNGGTDITLVTNLVYAQTVDETGIVAASETVSAGTMTLFNSGSTAVGSIVVGTSLSTGDFGLTSDGAGGTDVVVQTAFGTYANGLTLLVNPTTIGSLASVSGTSASAVGVTGPLGTAWTLTNLGAVSETGTGSIGVSLAASGTITNATSGSITAAQVGISLAAGGLVSAQASGSISGIIGIKASGAAATIVNAGSIAGNNTAGAGITLSAGGSVTNQVGGTISGGYGVDAVSVAATIVNAGSIGDGTSLPTGTGIYLFHGGAVTNQSGGRIIAGFNGIYLEGAAGTLINAGTVASGSGSGNGLISTAGGGITNQTGGVITGRYGVRAETSAFMVVNAGSIGGGTAFGAGVLLDAGGSVTNQVGGIITGFEGVSVSAGTTVENAGSIGGSTAVSFAAGAGNRLLVDPGATFTGSVNGGNTIGGSFASTLELTSGNGTLTGLDTQFVNFAQTTIDAAAAWTLSGANTVVAGATVTVGGTLSDAGTLINRGTINNTGGINASHYGLILRTGGTFTNLGSASLIEGPVGVEAASGATVSSFGTIASTSGTLGTAITMNGVGDRLIDNPGAVFIGSIANPGSLNVLELASASTAGTITGLGSSVTNFSSVAFDAGAHWTVAGNASASGLGGSTVIQGFAVGDTIDLTGFAAISRSFASNSLTLNNGSTTQTLHIVGSLSTSNFLIASDGSGGTDITLVNLVPPVISGAMVGQTVNDNATDRPFSGVTITDANPAPQSETVTITLTAASVPTDLDGTLSGSGLTRTGTGIYTLTAASASAATSAVDALVFTPTAHLTSPGNVVTTGFTLAVTDTAAESATDSTTTVLATAVNDPPVITGTVAGQTETDAATSQPFSGVTIADPDLGAAETLSITLSDGGSATDADGTFYGPGLTKTGIGTYTLATGTPSAVTTALHSLVFVPVAGVAAPGQTVTTAMTLSVTDGIVSSPTTDSTTSMVTTELIVPCFAAGTRIATPRGAVPVERLREGDVLLTLSGKPRAIQWIGTRTVDCRRHAHPDRVKPIRIAAHAFGENRPERPLFLSPDHSVFVEDVLIPVKHLVNDTTITQVNVRTVTYYHIELPAHDVVLAEGLPAETYLETGGRNAFENGGGAMQLHPDFAPDEARVAMVWQNFGYAPLIGSNGELERLQSRLATQAIMLGYRPGEAAKPSRKAARR